MDEKVAMPVSRYCSIIHLEGWRKLMKDPVLTADVVILVSSVKCYVMAAV
jgi:hypothetical protein